jgi:hypothetical protein
MTAKLHLRPLILGLAIALAGFQSAAVGQESSPATTTPATATAATGTYAGGDGSSIEKAIIIRAKNSHAGVRAEYDWLMQKFPGFKRVLQSLLTPGDGKAYDEIVIDTADGRRLEIYFDISAFFGKL